MQYQYLNSISNSRYIHKARSYASRKLRMTHPPTEQFKRAFFVDYLEPSSRISPQYLKQFDVISIPKSGICISFWYSGVYLGIVGGLHLGVVRQGALSKVGACLGLILRPDGQASLSHLTNTCTWTKQEMSTRIIIHVRIKFSGQTCHSIEKSIPQFLLKWFTKEEFK